jgi:hypothetical protein
MQLPASRVRNLTVTSHDVRRDPCTKLANVGEVRNMARRAGEPSPWFTGQTRQARSVRTLAWRRGHVSRSTIWSVKCMYLAWVVLCVANATCTSINPGLHAPWLGLTFASCGQEWLVAPELINACGSSLFMICSVSVGALMIRKCCQSMA